MIWRFTILNNRTSVATVVDEPTGWDANTSEIKRDLDWHGIFFTSQGETFQFDGVAMRLIKSEYEAYGVQADMTLIMEEDCGNGFEEFSRGKFMFKNYEFICGNECYVKVPIETTTEVKSLRNRINQKVDLESVLSFDNVELPYYSKLPFEMELPSKGVEIVDSSTKVNSTTELVNNNGVVAPVGSYTNYSGTIEFALDDKSNEIGNYGFYPNTVMNAIGTSASPPLLLEDYPAGQISQEVWDGSSYSQFVTTPSGSLKYVQPDYLTPIINYQEGTNNYNAEIELGKLEFLLAGEIEPLNDSSIGALVFYFMRKDKDGNFYYIDKKNIYDNQDPPPSVGLIGTTKTYKKVQFSFSHSDLAFQLNKDDQIFIFIWAFFSTSHYDILNGLNNFKMSIYAGSFFKFETLSKSPATTSKVFAVNEALSRIVESITNNNLKVYSEYFGRTDSQPYNHSEDGIGGLEVITNGLRIRRQENKVGETNKFSVSLQDMWEGLNPIHNIGMGLEPDTNRPGYNRLRVEDWKFFYNDVPLLTCDNVDKISRKTNEREIFSTFQFGYTKWEAEEYTGLDEFLTKRTYRTTINAIKNDFIKLSKFVGSGYALEITRRKGDDSKDWRYDKETFIICCTRKSDTVINLDFTDSNSFNIVNASPFIYAGGSIVVSGTLYNNGTYSIVAVTYAGSYYIVDVVQSTFAEVVDANVSNSAVSVISVELGNITTPENIIDPDTIYNFRISPVRNAMRWMNKVLVSYRQFNANSKLIFTDGDANYFAKGEMTSTVGKLEAAPIREDVTIARDLLSDMLKAMPFLIPERVVFDYPLTSREYKILMENPYGTIYFSSGGNSSTSDKIISEANQFMLAEYGANLIPEDAKYSSNNNQGCEEGYGWIDTIVYKPEQGIATFNLIPKQI
jgi:hypothetical protein